MKPEVICHIMGSVDGRLLPLRWTLPFDGTAPGLLFREYAEIGRQLGTDAWMFGKSTLREIFSERFVSESDRHPEDGALHHGDRNSDRLFITVDPEADILFTSGTLRGDNILTVIGCEAGNDYLAMLEEKGISYIALEDPTDLRRVMEMLHDRFGVRRISLQGGGIIDGEMLAAGMLDELSLVIYPGIDGLASSPSIFEYFGSQDTRPAQGQSLEFLSADIRSYGILWLRYRFHKTAFNTCV